MNDFENIIDGAIGSRADGAPTSRPDFGDVLADRQQRMRRRSVVGAAGVLAIGVTGMAAFAVGGPTDSTADGPGQPVDSNGAFVATTMPGSVSPTTAPGASVPGETVWYCEGALDRYESFPATTVAPTTTIAPPTTLASASDAELVPEATYVPPLEDSGYFRSCVLVRDVSAAEVAPAQTFVEQYPTTTVVEQIPPADSGVPSD